MPVTSSVFHERSAASAELGGPGYAGPSAGEQLALPFAEELKALAHVILGVLARLPSHRDVGTQPVAHFVSKFRFLRGQVQVHEMHTLSSCLSGGAVRICKPTIVSCGRFFDAETQRRRENLVDSGLGFLCVFLCASASLRQKDLSGLETPASCANMALS